MMRIKSTSNGNAMEESGWKNLPQDIVMVIMKRLCLADSIRFQAVCLHWRDAAAKTILDEHYSPASQVPWLLVDMRHNNKTFDFKFLSLSEKRFYNLKVSPGILQDLHNLHCIGCFEGWLVMVGEIWTICRCNLVRNFLLNPLSGAVIKLPSESTITKEPERESLKKVILSASPTSPSCNVAALTSKDRLAFCKPTHTKWTLVTQHLFKDIAFVDDGKLYALLKNSREFIIIMNILCEEENENQIYIVEHSRVQAVRPLKPAKSQREDNYLIVFDTEVPYLVKSCEGELMLLMRCFNSSYTYNETSIESILTTTKRFRAFKLDQNGHKWMETNLEDQILFVSDGNSQLMRETDIPSTHKAIESGNCIYFAFMNDIQVGAFCLDSGKIKNLRSNNAPHFRFLQGIAWFIPNAL